MSNDWKQHDGPEWEDDSIEDRWSPDLQESDPDAWRGGAPADADAWRGEAHQADWPAWNAGPEYLMWKRIAEEEG
jgi:hypothetical protein